MVEIASLARPNPKRVRWVSFKVFTFALLSIGIGLAFISISTSLCLSKECRLVELNQPGNQPLQNGGVNGRPQNHQRSRRNAQGSGASGNITVKGNIIFRNGSEPETIPASSQLKVTFQDVSKADAAAELLAETLVNVTGYKKGSVPLKYEVVSRRPSRNHHMYSVHAVLNMGWRPVANRDGTHDWLRTGDYHTDTSHSVNVTQAKSVYSVDIELVQFNAATSLGLVNSVMVILLIVTTGSIF